MIYLDHHAATPLCLPAREAMLRAHEQAWANPDSVHTAGRRAHAERENARQRIAAALGAKAADLVFAASGTEALNLAALGIARARARQGARQFVTSAVEHPSLRAVAQQLSREGQDSIALPVLEGRAFSGAALDEVLRVPTSCVALQWVNHETGTLFPIHEYAALCRERGVPLVVDASQAFGKIEFNIEAFEVSALVVSSAKIGGPAGAAALWHKRGINFDSILHGGEQERGYRPGTPNVVALAGFGAAAAALAARLAAVPGITALRDRFEEAAQRWGASLNAATGPRVGTVCNVSFPGWRSDLLVAAMDVEGVCVSAGAACSSGLSQPSPVLLAMYPDQAWRAASALRISFGPETTSEDVDHALAALRRLLDRAP